MPKKYKEENVYVATMQRYEMIFKEFNHIYLSISGGKDSSLMLQLMAKKARELNKKFSILFIDLEAQYNATIKHVEQLIASVEDVTDKVYWVALPLSLRNAVSIIQPKWICWDEKDKEKWVREMPQNKYVINIENISTEWNWFHRGMEFEEFILQFAKWFAQSKGERVATGIGIRANESFNRFKTIISKTKEKYQEYAWTTKVRFTDKKLKAYNFYPLYDWLTEDVWIAVSKEDLLFNEIYELMYKNGLSIHEQRLCQPYGDDQRDGIDQFRTLEPETWERVLNRVHGVNFGNIYARTSLLGNMRSEKPTEISWEQYSIFLLESIGIYAPELRDHYYQKINKFFKWHEKHQSISIKDIPDEADLKMESAKKTASWRRIARAIEKNDFWMKRLSFSQTKKDVERLFELKKKYANIIRGKDTDDKDLAKVAKELNKND
jgi:Predicted phosphoadenosine phosphosulfate sulfotransferase